MVPLLCLFSFDTNFDKFPNYKPVGIKTEISPSARCLSSNVKTDTPKILHQRALSHKSYLSLGRILTPNMQAYEISMCS